ARVRAGGRADVPLRRLRGVLRDPRRRPAADRVVQERRRRRPGRVSPVLLERPAALHRGLAREPSRPGMDPGVAGGQDEARHLLLDINCADDPVENTGPLAALFYGFSVTYCMTTSLAGGGAGLGTCGLPPSKADELTRAAGFSSCEKLPLENPFNNLFDVRA